MQPPGNEPSPNTISWPWCYSTDEEWVSWYGPEQQWCSHPLTALGYGSLQVHCWRHDRWDPCLKALAKIFKEKYMKHYRQHRLSAQSLRHIHILYSASFLSTYLCLNRLRHFTSCLQAANSAIDSWDLCCTKKYIPCTSEISAAIQMYFAQPGGFKVNIQAAPQGFARLMF